MEFTGERAIEGKTPEGIMRSHRLRYELAANYCSGCDVLDIGCGAGYGSVTLLEEGSARSVLGIDISAEAVDYAHRAYARPGISFSVGDVLELSELDRMFDVIVCFETLEHVVAPMRALAQLASRLRPDGCMVLSTPNRILNSPGRRAYMEPWNPHHVREFSRRELRNLLRRYFTTIEWKGQCIFRLRGLSRVVAAPIRAQIEELYLADRCATIRTLRPYEEPFYFVPVCRGPLHPQKLSTAKRLSDAMKACLKPIIQRVKSARTSSR